MRSPRRTLALAAPLALLLVPVLAGCGEDDSGSDKTPPESSSPRSPSEPGSESTGTTSPPSGALPPACDVLTAAEVEAAFGVPFGAGSLGGGGHAEQDLEWQSDNCSFEAQDLVEVTLALTGPDDFTGGELVCPEPSDIASVVEPADVPGAADAWWDRNDAPPLEADLRVCTEGYNFDIKVEYEDGVDFQGDPKQQSIELATVVLSKLG